MHGVGSSPYRLSDNRIIILILITSLRLHADYTTECASDVSRMVLQCVVNSDLCVLSRCLGMNHLRIDAAKTQAVANGPS